MMMLMMMTMIRSFHRSQWSVPAFVSLDRDVFVGRLHHPSLIVPLRVEVGEPDTGENSAWVRRREQENILLDESDGISIAIKLFGFCEVESRQAVNTFGHTCHQKKMMSQFFFATRSEFWKKTFLDFNFFDPEVFFRAKNLRNSVACRDQWGAFN